ncbi:MAG: DNA-directed RNA polymerase subunit beta [Elusimicrobiaceae bacterium]|jgi:DNA-directed RNA polymerase subunit beta|nr:DNA-directed RNA polymerase subunit beta [Elusimicrobiaceae bacterium]MBT4402494.1 DNA-directed RNA polymerase subunit beta [Elusimicrobiaceae bacterium]MBT4440142.1 DNA-directed RNA polymerase subunit beta [Elusimicrobiaceae bacterium]MBT5988078.1 DNA-directed RNA polymerase subunit beta [Elusimicrobiaceae bacterium]MBT6715119.1 DNA-directed RNA polymerase subunit beta [Elusimicrobiaceae bacterium]
MKHLNFGKIKTTIDMPNLLDMQKDSFVDFLQEEITPKNRQVKGLQAAFEDIFPIEAPDGNMILDFIRYEIGAPKYLTPEEAILRDGTYSAPLKLHTTLSIKQKNGKLKKVTEQDVMMCDLPLMTDSGCFIFNGAERVVVSQLHRSPAIIFEEDEEKKQSTLGKKLFYARVIPYRGIWVEFFFDLNNALWVRLDRKKKFPAGIFLRACGLENNAEIIQSFYPCENLEIKVSKIDNIVGRYAAEDIVDKKTGEVLWNLDEKATAPIDDKLFKQLLARKIDKIKVIAGNPRQDSPAILATLEMKKDSIKTPQEAQYEIYKKLRGQDFIVKEHAESFLDNILFKNIRRYDLSFVGRYKINKKFKFMFERLSKFDSKKYKIPTEKKRTLCYEDIVVTLQYLIALNNGDEATAKEYGTEVQFKTDDIDHLGNRRVRGVGELLENQIRVGLSQMARAVRDRMNRDLEDLTPRALMNTQPVQAIVKKFFGTSQLSQFMDQINPLSELTHKRRLSALGPGGLNRKRAGFEVRDVHHTHYGRVCPIETPEGPNIGLITSLACYSKINNYGLIEAAYRKVDNGKVTDKVDYLIADKEDDYTIAQSDTPTTSANKLDSDTIYCRYQSNYPILGPKEVDYMDISPLQVISISAALIPFLEHDDANRALMGCNMQRQAVPLLLTEPPLVGTGVEESVARDSGAAVVAKRAGTVIQASADFIAIEPKDKTGNKTDFYQLIKYKRSNQDTCINQRPIVKSGDIVKANQVLADGPAMKDGKLALGRNLLLAFMSWEGFNYEDAILISEKLVKDDTFTSIHLHEFNVDARNTKLGSEEITRDIPNIGAEAFSHLDEEGIVVPSTVVKAGDILVGKVTPKGEQQLTPEERLLKVIFGKKADDVVDASLRVPPGTTGKVIGTRVFVRKEKISKKEARERQSQLEKERDFEIENLAEQKKIAIENLKENCKDKAKCKNQETKLKGFFKLMEKRLLENYDREIELSKEGDELSVTVNKSVKVFVASKRKIQVGDKLSGRHGNKGVIAKILPEEDMPYLPDGTPLDIVLSPLGIPSRMNVGQLFETMLGWAAKNLNITTSCPVFESPSEEVVIDYIKKAKDELKSKGVAEKYLPDNYCRTVLYDGRTGERFTEKVTIGYMYVMKLVHLVEDKVHARSIGPYSLITRQPLGGKAQFGGQRFGEMEVWAIEGYGATYALQEFLTVKSDDFIGRTKMYESIVKGDAPQAPGVPESFKVLVKELQALGIDVNLIKKQKKGTDKEEIVVISEEKKQESKIAEKV